MNDSSCIFEIIYNTMQQSHNTMSIKTLCAMAGVSRSGYYAWLNAAPARAQREQQDREDFEQILTAYKMHGSMAVLVLLNTGFFPRKSI
jgi:putative transposase